MVGLVGFMEFNATFNNISVILWRSVLLLDETGGPRENHQPAASHWQTLPYNVVLLTLSWSRPTTSVVIDTDCIGSSHSNYHTITTMTSRGEIRMIRPFQLFKACLNEYKLSIKNSIIYKPFSWLFYHFQDLFPSFPLPP